MLTKRSLVSIFSLTTMILNTGVVSAQDYPIKPIRIVTSVVGGDNDFTARVVGQSVSSPLGQPVVIENRATSLAVDFVAKAPPDGYTLLLAGRTLWIEPFLDKVPYDPVRDFSPITITTGQPSVLVLHPSLPVKSVKELIALARARPGELNYGSGSTGSTNHLTAQLFKSMAGIDIVRINYKGGAGAINSLVGGEVHLMFQPPFAVAPHLKLGRLKALAVTSAQPSVLAPGLPTIAASGLPGYEVLSVTGIFAPGKTPAAIINRLNQEIVRVLNRADVREKLFNVGVEAVGSSPDELAARIKSEMAQWGKIIKDAGIKVQ